ncbi:MAG: RdgB/HAM1 family non-canonical purine NTP pyrophosphatase [Candidatus Nitrosotenuis sp.]|nr:MAG: RdgB/HAM1 family non-canonical purine NTP pyrophosphatase [Candidatus Nitrosotenuis sp.]
MRKSFDLYFASSNKHKYSEAKEILSKFRLDLGFFEFAPVEIQSDSILEIATKKSLDAYLSCKKPVIVEDDGLFIPALGGFPGPYSSYVFKTIGNAGILNLVESKRNAEFHSVIAYCDGKKPVLFRGIIRGMISKKQKGKGWGYDPIFIPKGRTKTYAELDDKNTISHRYVALGKFARWFDKQESSGR